MMDREDAFWAAKQVAAFSDAEIRAIVDTGELSDPLAADWVAECLIRRRDKIAEAWFSKVLPLDQFRVVNGTLEFDDLPAKSWIRVAGKYDIRWSSFDNGSGLEEIPGARGNKIPAPGGKSEFLAATIACEGPAEAYCSNPLTVYLKRAGTSFEVVGIDR
jgi:hypothetical protein